MINKRNIFFGVIFLLIVFVIAINFNTFIGETVRGSSSGMFTVTEITAFPKEILSGEEIHIDIIPGCPSGADIDIGIYKSGKKHAIVNFKDASAGFGRYKCNYPAIISYKTGGSWSEGEYIIKVKDIGSGEFIEDNFYIAG